MNVLMPQLGETVNEGTIAVWHKKVGDAVEKNEPLLDVETDKAAVEVPASDTGVISAINVAEGETVDVGTVLAVIDVAGEKSDEPKAVVENAAEKAVEKAASEVSEPAAVPTTSDSANSVTPMVSNPSVSDPLASNSAARLSPSVRKLVAEHKLDIATITGTGKKDRVTRQDVLAFIGKAPAVAVSAPQAAVVGRTTPVPAPMGTDSRSLIPFDRIRKLTGDHMVMSKATSPHVLQAVEVDYAGVDAVRKSVGPAWRADKGYSLTYLPFIAKAIVMGLVEFPKINSSIVGEALQLHPLINLGIAVDLNFEGLVVPVVQDCASRSVGQIAEAIKTLSDKARSKGLTPDDFAGGTYTISNSGAFGTLMTAPVINQPQTAIMSTDGIRKRPVVIESAAGDSIAIRPVGILAQSFDHRAFDGAYSAAFLNRVRNILEQHDWSSEV
ncbi:MAG: 2-oxo acid dehydrogenase subunit E2 [Proteobacteria bacterium]|nr:2-oxo acid dehydrogenase subunit E2 [Pseudomonadota bacterium]